MGIDQLDGQLGSSDYNIIQLSNLTTSAILTSALDCLYLHLQENHAQNKTSVIQTRWSVFYSFIY